MTITDPWLSRPMDVHRWSGHPEAGPLVAGLWAAHYSDFDDPPGKPGPKPKTSYRQQFRALLLDLYVAWVNDPDLCIGVPMSANGWNANSRYNALGLSKKMIPIIKRAHEVGLIDLARGSYSGPYGRGNRNTRIRAAEPLRALFREAKLSLSAIERHPEQECLVLKRGDREVEYDDTADTRAMRDRLRAYNGLLNRTFIDIPTLDDPVIEREVRSGPGEGTVDRILIGSTHQFVRRIFSRGSWELNGRFYGPWWQQVGADWRSRIFINDAPTVEIDFRALHVHLLALMAGVVLEDDPYTYPPNTVPGTPAPLQREIFKTLLLKAINARDRLSAFNSFRQGWPTGHMAKRLGNDELSRLIDVVVAKYPFMSGKLCQGHGISLMYTDSQITDRVFSRATHHDIPVLGVHDSFIVDSRRVRALKVLMRMAAQEVVGRELPFSANNPAPDEIPDPRSRDAYIAARQLPRTGGYVRRRAAHEERHGPLT